MTGSMLRWAVAAVVAFGVAAGARAAGVESAGNVDGLLTWRIGALEPGESAREVVLLVFDKSPQAAGERLAAARQKFAKPVEERPAVRPPQERPVGGVVWIKNVATDFALAGPGHFFWEGLRQSLASPQGGQLSRFGYYVHYNDGAPRRAGTPITHARAENLRIVEPMRAIDATEAAGLVETADRALRIRIGAAMGDGPTTAVEFVLTNAGDKRLGNVRLSVYANLEAAHTHEDDYGTLDRDAEGLLVVDPSSGACVAMAGLNRPTSGYAGVWPSQKPLQEAAGVELAKWPRFTAVPAELRQRLARAAAASMPHAPAPPHEPDEPPTRDLTADEAQAALRADWLFQADGKPTADRTLQETVWARELAERLKRDPQTRDLTPELAELAALEKQIGAAGQQQELGRELHSRAGGGSATVAPTSVADLYFAVRAVKRRLVLANPAVNFSQVLLLDNPYPQGAEWPHQARHRNGMMAVSGGRLLVLDGLHPGGRVRKLAPEEPGSFWRPDLSFDARRVLFCFKPHAEKSFHLYEINADGTGLRQLTAGEYDDVDPLYLPDGRIVFTTTRCNTYVRCMPYTYSYVLARCDADGRNIYLLSQNNEPDWCPALLNDGRVIYSRWEYHDKALWRIQSLWTANPDGTGVAAFWGNQSVWPDHLAEPRPIPGSRRVMFTGLAHHDWFAGSIGIIDPEKGFNFPHGLTKVTCDVPWPECGQPPSDPREAADYHPAGKYTAYKTPYPLSEEDFLVSARRGGREDKFRLYLMDVHGNRELIYEGHYNVWHAMPLVPRPAPPQHPDRVAWPGTGVDRKPPAPGALYSADVYQGVPDLPRGSVKFLRVIQMDARTYSSWTRDGRFSGPVVSAVQDDGVKRILGTVPVEPDGSVSFQAPAGKALHFQLLDEEYRALQTMRSFTGVMPGEQRGCVGCHESHSTTPVGQPAAALKRSPASLAPPPWGAKSISYEQLVQPVLDRYCGKCHQGEGEGRKTFDLTLRPGRGPFKEPYLSLIGYANYNNLGLPPGPPGIAGAVMCENFAQSDPRSYVTLRPMRHLSYTSRLVERCASGKHHDVKLDPTSLRQVIGWVDANCPFRGEEDVRAIADPRFPGIESLPVQPRTHTAPDVPRP